MVRNVLEIIRVNGASVCRRGAVSGLALLLGALAILSFGPRVSAQGDDDSGAVYVLTNSTAGNAVIVYGRAEDGSLTQVDWETAPDLVLRAQSSCRTTTGWFSP